MSNQNVMKELDDALSRIRKTVTLKPRAALVLGSGLGDLANRFENRQVIPFSDIPGFPHAKVAGHAGNLVFGKLGGLPVVAMQGRVHFYEGHPMSKVVFGIRLMRQLGAHTLITSNAVGSVNKSFRVGDLMLIEDHINFLADHPLRGSNIDELGPRFYDMSTAYDEGLRKIAKRVGKKLKARIQEGVYAATLGPSYETPAEIRMFRGWGADTVGMSTVPEILAARHMGMRCLAISLITNMAAGVLRQKLNHAEVVEAANRVARQFQDLIAGILADKDFEKDAPAGPHAK